MVINIEPTNYRAYNNLGKVLSDRGEVKEARKYYKRVLDSNPEYNKALRYLGRLLMKIGKDEKGDLLISVAKLIS